MQVTPITGFPVTRLSAPVSVPRRSTAADTFRPLPESARATRPNQADALFNAFVFVSRKTPRVDDLSGPIAALRLASAGRDITQRFVRSDLPILSEVERRPRFTETRVGFLETLKDRLKTLSRRVADLLDAGGLNTRSATASPPGPIEVTAGPKTPFGESSLRPARLAQGQVLASDALPDTPLGFSGRFLINGTAVTVEAGDDLFNIRDKINLGEDVNGNGTLDGPEDLNGNGVADILRVEGGSQGPDVFVIEDVNGNGTLEGTEDLNGNNRLDGGIQNTGVAATVENGRLVLTSLTGGASDINLQDPNGVLLELGFFELNAKGLPIQKEVQIDFNRLEPANLNTRPQTAQLETGGKTLSSDTNRFTDALDDAEVQLNRTSEQTVDVTVAFEAGSAIDLIQTLFDDFNTVVRSLNEVLQERNLFSEDLETQALRQDLVQDPERRIRQAQQRNDNIEAQKPGQTNPRITGLTVENTEKFTTKELFITRTAEAIDDGRTLPFRATGNLLFQRLSQVGIRTLEDDTVTVDRATLDQALRTNPQEVEDLLFNPDTGLLSLLQPQLENLLREDLGRIDLKITRLQALGGLPSRQGDRFRRAVENTLLQQNVRTLIAVA